MAVLVIQCQIFIIFSRMGNDCIGCYLICFVFKEKNFVVAH